MSRLHRAALALACAFVCMLSAGATSAFAATVTATPATVWNVVKAAGPGDVVQLASGAYGPLALYNMTKAAPGVLVQPAPGAAVSLSALLVDGSTNMTFSGFDVQMLPTTQYALELGGVINVVMDHLRVHQADNATLSGVGFFIRNSSQVVIRNSEFSWSGIGGSVMDSDHIQITGNTVHDVNVDGVDIPGSSFVTVSNNVFHDFHPGAGDHPDAVQWYATALHPKPTDITITGNRIDRGAGGPMQGVFGEDGLNVTITGNAMRGTLTNGIGLARTVGAVISNNFVDGYPDLGTRIIIRGGCDKVSITGNAAQEVQNYVTAGEAPCTNFTITGNTVLKPAALGDDTLLNAWLAGQGAPPTPAPPPVIVPPPPATDPRDAQIAALTQQLAAAKAQVSSDAQAIAAAQASVQLLGQLRTDFAALNASH